MRLGDPGVGGAARARGRHPRPRLLQLRALPRARDAGPRPPLGRARPQRAHRPHAGRRPALRPRRCPRRVAPQPGDLRPASRPAPHAPRPRRPRPAPRLPPLLALHLAPQPRHPPRRGARRPLPRALGTRTRLRRTQDSHLRTRRNAAQQSARPRGARSLGPVAGLQPRPPRHEPRGAARPRAPGAPELSLRPPRRPGLLARRVGHVPRHAPSTPRGVARRARALRAPRAPAPSLSPRRQDQDEQLSAESSPSPEIPCKVTGIEARGTLMTRPSTRCATISSFVTRTSRIRGSPPAAVVIPRLHDLLVMLSNDLAYPSQLVCCKPMVPREHQRVEPELAGVPVSLHVDVGRLVAIEAGEEEPIRSGDATDAWHSRAPILPSRCHPGIFVPGS